MTAYLFPSRLSQSCDRVELSSLRPDLLEAACAVTRSDNPFARAHEDPRFEQPVLTALSLARWSTIEDRSPRAAFLGHATGDVAALAAAGAISEVDAVWLAAVRGRMLSEVAAKTDHAALILRSATLRDARQLAIAHRLRIASDDAPGEVVLVGPRALVDAAFLTARKVGIRVVKIPRAGALPCPELACAKNAWRAALWAAEIGTPKTLVVSCVTARPIVDTRLALTESLTASVRFRQALLAVRAFGVHRFVGVDAGGRLAKLAKRVLPTADVETLTLATTGAGR
jgi:[acyl-carrier-protein] S-malonyltransferase